MLDKKDCMHARACTLPRAWTHARMRAGAYAQTPICIIYCFFTAADISLQPWYRITSPCVPRSPIFTKVYAVWTYFLTHFCFILLRFPSVTIRTNNLSGFISDFCNVKVHHFGCLCGVEASAFGHIFKNVKMLQESRSITIIFLSALIELRSNSLAGSSKTTIINSLCMEKKPGDFYVYPDICSGLVNLLDVR